MPAKPRRRARNLDDHAIHEICAILDGWSSPKLTWELLNKQVLLRLRASYTRQALHNHVRIKEAFSARKKALAGHDSKERKEATPEQQRIARLEAENERLKRENHSLLEQFNRWVYNGHLKQMDSRMRDFMNRPLPKVHRDRSQEPTKPSATRKK